MIKPPPSSTTYSDRDLDCQTALEAEFQDLAARAEVEGWSPDKVARALLALSLAHIKARIGLKGGGAGNQGCTAECWGALVAIHNFSAPHPADALQSQINLRAPRTGRWHMQKSREQDIATLLRRLRQAHGIPLAMDDAFLEL